VIDWDVWSPELDSSKGILPGLVIKHDTTTVVFSQHLKLFLRCWDTLGCYEPGLHDRNMQRTSLSSSTKAPWCQRRASNKGLFLILQVAGR